MEGHQSHQEVCLVSLEYKKHERQKFQNKKLFSDNVIIHHTMGVLGEYTRGEYITTLNTNGFVEDHKFALFYPTASMPNVSMTVLTVLSDGREGASTLV